MSLKCGRGSGRGERQLSCLVTPISLVPQHVSDFAWGRRRGRDMLWAGWYGAREGDAACGILLPKASSGFLSHKQLSQIVIILPFFFYFSLGGGAEQRHNGSTKEKKPRERSRSKKQGGRAAPPSMVLLLSVGWSLVWSLDKQQEKKISQGISLRLSLLLLPTMDFPSTEEWAESSQTPSLYHREIHFPAEIQLYKIASLSFICRRKDVNGCLEPSLLFHNLPARAASSQVLHRKGHQPICSSWAETGTLCEGLTARGGPSHGGMTVHLLYSSCPRAFSNHPHPGDIPRVIPAKQVVMDPSYFPCLPTPTVQ